MIAATGRGLLLTCLWYIREVDPQTLLLTGLTRDGIYLVENGEVTAAVNNFRFNESPVGMLARMTEVGATVADPVPRVGRLFHPHRHAAAAGGRLQHVVGEPGQLGRATGPGSLRRGRSGVLEPEPDLQAHLVVGHAAVLDLAPDLGDLEPVQVPQGLSRPVQARCGSRARRPRPRCRRSPSPGMSGQS